MDSSAVAAEGGDEAVDVARERLLGVAGVVDEVAVGLGAVEVEDDVGGEDAVGEEGVGLGLVLEVVADSLLEGEHGAGGLVERAFVEFVGRVVLVDGVPDALSAFEAATLYFEDEDAVVGEEDEVDFGAALGVVVGEAEGVEADPAVGVGGVSDGFEEALFCCAADGGVDGGGDHAGHEDFDVTLRRCAHSRRRS